MKEFALYAFLLIGMSTGCVNPTPEQVLQDSEARKEVFSRIAGDHELMSEFMEVMMQHEHAMMMMQGNKQMMSHMMGGQGMQHMMGMMKDDPEMMQGMMRHMMSEPKMMNHMMQMMHRQGMMSTECMQEMMEKMKMKMNQQGDSSERASE